MMSATKDLIDAMAQGRLWNAMGDGEGGTDLPTRGGRRKCPQILAHKNDESPDGFPSRLSICYPVDR
jgi:hypothetical protein